MPVLLKDADLERRWIAALRSGNYAQTTKTMCEEVAPSKYRYCAFGVLCILARIPVDEDGISGINGRSRFDALFINSQDEEVIFTRNDRDGWSFREIADAIESGRGLNLP